MRKFLYFVPLVALLVLAVWFAVRAWTALAGTDIPVYGYLAMAGGVLFSLVVGCGLMALAFYSNRHGYDDLSGGDSDRH
ncbi:MAG TPA: hypothetical protein VFX37_00655 [Pseudolabrys sp.]|nr:hypothetical protein [Pseudolabrys sp.]